MKSFKPIDTVAVESDCFTETVSAIPCLGPRLWEHLHYSLSNRSVERESVFYKEIFGYFRIEPPKKRQIICLPLFTNQLSFSPFLPKIVTTLLLHLGVNFLGLYIKFLTDRSQRNAFLDTRCFIETRYKTETENKKQVSAFFVLNSFVNSLNFGAAQRPVALKLLRYIEAL